MQSNGTPSLEIDGKSVETDKTTWSEFSNGQKAIIEQIPTSEQRNKSKRPLLRDSQ